MIGKKCPNPPGFSLSRRREANQWAANTLLLAILKSCIELMKSKHVHLLKLILAAAGETNLREVYDHELIIKNLEDPACIISFWVRTYLENQEIFCSIRFQEHNLRNIFLEMIFLPLPTLSKQKDSKSKAHGKPLGK